MTPPTRAAALLGLLLFAATPLLHAQTPPPNPFPSAPMTPQTQHATGPFNLKLAPQPLADTAADPKLSRMSIDKQFHGDLEASSRGEMLSAMTATKGSAGYVAIEHVTGTLGGRTGAFTLQHTATMDRGTPHLLITVVPDSGTEALTGLTGTMNILIAPDGKHSYEFSYTLPSH